MKLNELLVKLKHGHTFIVKMKHGHVFRVAVGFLICMHTKIWVVLFVVFSVFL